MLLAFVLAFLPATARTSVQNVPAPPRTVSGTVTAPGGSPLAGITVVLLSDTAGSGDVTADPRRTTTSASGSFRFDVVASGRYRVATADAAELTEWPDADVIGRLRAGSLPVDLTEAGTIRIDLVVAPEPGIRRIVDAAMSRQRIEQVGGPRRGPPGGRSLSSAPPRPSGTASISGMVTAEGAPVVGATVALMLERTVSGRRALAPTASRATTGSDGGYTLPNLLAGRYVAVVLASGTGPMSASGIPDEIASPQPRTERQPHEALATTFHPGSVHPEGAAGVTVAADEQRRNVDIDMLWVTAAPVSGTVSAQSGTVRPGARAVLVPAVQAAQLGGHTARWATLTPAGRFEFGHVPSGPYQLTVNAGSSGWVRRDVMVGLDAIQLELELQRPFIVSGRIEFRMTGRAESPGNPAEVTVRLMPERLQAGSVVATATAGADGSFTLRGVPGGRYRLQATSSGGWVQSAGFLDDTDTLDVASAVTGDRDEGRVVMVDQETAVLAVVTDAEGRPVTEGRVAIFSADRRRWVSGSRSVRVIRLSPTGTVSATGLPAGPYLIAVVPSDDQAPVNNRRLESFEERATPFLLAEGEQKRIPLRIQ